MGSALLRGWIASKSGHTILVVEPNPSGLVKEWAKSGAIGLYDPAETSKLPQLRAVVLALKPQAIKVERGLLQLLGPANALVISIAAGITSNWLSSQLGTGARIVRAMPNTPGSIGQGISVLCATREAAPDDRELA